MNLLKTIILIYCLLVFCRVLYLCFAVGLLGRLPAWSNNGKVLAGNGLEKNILG